MSNISKLTKCELDILSQLVYFESKGIMVKNNKLRLTNIQKISKSLDISRIWYYNSLKTLNEKNVIKINDGEIEINLETKDKIFLCKYYENIKNCGNEV